MTAGTTDVPSGSPRFWHDASMAAIDPYSALPLEKFAAANWKECARNFSPNGAAMFGPGGGEYTLVGDVYFLRTPAAIRFFLGYSNVTPVPQSGTPGGGYFLARTPPVYHPMFPRLVCVSAAAEPFHVKPRTRNNTKTAKIAEFQLPDPGTLPAGASTGYGTIDGTSLGNMTSYDLSRITARFAPVNYRMLNDSQIQIVPGGQEWRRWCYVNTSPKAEVLSLSGFKSLYYEGTGTTPPISSPSPGEYPSDIGLVLIKSDVEIVWSDVPSEWIFTRDPVNNTDFVPFPRNILLGLGTVNTTNFLNYLAGTLRLDSARLERSPWPLAAGTESRCNYDITFGCSFFDPPKGYTGNPPVQLNRVDGSGEPTDTRGHNCAPARGKFVAGDINAGMWFGASYNGSSTGRALFGKSEFRKLFNSPLNDP